MKKYRLTSGAEPKKFMSDIVRLNVRSGSVKAKMMDDHHSETHEVESPEDLLTRQFQMYYEKGYIEGQNAIKLDLEKDYTSRLLEKTEEFNEILRSLDQNLKNYEQAFDKIVIDVSIVVAEKILQKEIEKTPVITSSLKDSIRKVLGANEILIKINPKDYNVINEERSTLLLEESFSKIKFEHDDRIEPGGCFVETEIGNVDSRISTQLAEIKKQLETSFTNTLT